MRAWRDAAVAIGFFGMALNVWAATVDAALYVYKGDPGSIIWMTINFGVAAMCVANIITSLRLAKVGYLIALYEKAMLEAVREPTPENARKVIDLHKQTNLMVKKYFPRWTK